MHSGDIAYCTRDGKTETLFFCLLWLETLLAFEARIVPIRKTRPEAQCVLNGPLPPLPTGLVDPVSWGDQGHVGMSNEQEAV